MTKIKILPIIISSCLFLFPFITNAQFSALIGPGTSSYSGDVSGEWSSNLRPALNAELWYQINRHLYLKSGASLYQIQAQDVIPSRNRAFKATNFEVYTSLMLGGNPDWKLMPFTYVGIGISTNSPQYAVTADGTENFLNAKALNTEGVDIPGAFTIFPTGLGVRYRINEKFALVADAGLRITNSDLLDGVSTSSIDVNDLSPESINYFDNIIPGGLNGATRIPNGNPNRNDVFGIISIKLQIKLNQGTSSNSMPCPPFLR